MRNLNAGWGETQEWQTQKPSIPGTIAAAAGSAALARLVVVVAFPPIAESE